MKREEIFSFSAFELARKIREKQIRAQEAVEAVFQNIDEHESNIHAYISLDREAAMNEARHCDELVQKGGELPPLLGVPMAVKDNLLLKGRKATCGSRMLENYIPPFTATCVQKLQDAGAILIGKTNMDEFGMGISTEHSFFGPTRNPLDPARVPGGSSGGSAASVSGNMAFVALGTDTGGSVRQPAAYCGLVGLRPTYGTVSRHGLVAFASSMDIAGPLTRGTRDAAGICNIVTGVDPKDQTSISGPKIDISSLEKATFKGMRIGIPRELSGESESRDGFSLAISEEVKASLEDAVRILEEEGAQVEFFDMPILSYAVEMYYILSSAEASSNLSRFDGIRYGYRDPDAKDLASLYTGTRSTGFGLEVKRRILMGNYVLSTEHFDDCYRRAESARKKLCRSFDEAFSKYDVLLSPTTPQVAPLLGERGKDTLQNYISDLFTVPASLAGIPAVSVPFGKTSLPVGLQFTGPRFGEQAILTAARFLEIRQEERKRSEGRDGKCMNLKPSWDWKSMWN